MPADRPPEAQRTVEAPRPKLPPAVVPGPLAGVGDLRNDMRTEAPVVVESGYAPSGPQLVSFSTDLPSSGSRLVVQPPQFRSGLGGTSDTVIRSAIRSVARRRLVALTRV